MPKISVVVPVYNTEQYLSRCVDSVLNQSFNDIEVILVNDGSTDKSANICDSYKTLDNRIKVIHKANGGLSSARNAGVAAATAEYVYFVDSDDYLEPNAFETLLKAAASDVQIVVCGYYLDYPNKSKENYAVGGKYNSIEKMGQAFIELKAKHLFDTACNKLIRLSFLKENQISFPIGELYEDTAFNTNLLNYNPTLVVISDCLYHYVQRKGSITKRINPEKLDVLKKRATALIKTAELFKNDKVYAYCNYYYIKYLFSAFIDYSNPSGGYTARQKKQIIKQELTTKEFLSAIKYARGVSLAENLVVAAAKTKSVFVINLLSKILYKVR